MEEERKLFKFGVRHIFVFLGNSNCPTLIFIIRMETIIPGFLGFANVYAMRVNLSVAIVYMVKDPGMHWQESQQGIVLGMFFYGYVLTQLPGGRLAEIIGEPANLLVFLR